MIEPRTNLQSAHHTVGASNSGPIRLRRWRSVRERLTWPARGLWATTIVLLSLLLCACYFSPAAHAETITLPCGVDGAINQKRLINAIETANRTAIADTIVLTRGCGYHFAAPLVGSLVDALPVISATLTIEGNGALIAAGATMTDLRLLHTTANLTVHNLNLLPGKLSGSQWGAAILAEPGAILTLHNITLSGGKAPYGGGVTALGDLTITASSFRNNEATAKAGGAIYAQGQVTITQSVFEVNRATQYGGAIFLAEGGPAFIHDSHFDSNRAGSDGGAITALAPLIISRSDFYSNSSTLQGGAIYGEAPITLVDSALRQNRAGSKGGAIMTLEPLTGTHTIFLDNLARAGYGGAISASATVNLERNLFEANRSPLAGAVLYSEQQRGKSMIANNLFLDNQTAGFPKQPLLCTICDEFGGGEIELRHNTFVQSGQRAEIAIETYAGKVEAQYNIIVNHELAMKRNAGDVNSRRNLYFGNGQDEVNLTGSDNITGQDPQFVRPLLKDYRLTPDSPAVDHANGSTVALDAQGFHRPQHGVADIGAYEVDHGEVPASDVIRIGYCPANIEYGLIGLTEAIAEANARPGRQRIVSPGCIYAYYHTVTKNGGLPTITDALIIDGNESIIRYRNNTEQNFRMVRARNAALHLIGFTLVNNGQMADSMTCAMRFDNAYFPPPVAMLTEVTVKDNVCGGQGAALYAENYTVEIRNSRFENNGLINNDSQTAVVDTWRSWLAVEQSEFIGTAAWGSSTAIKVTNGGFDIRASLFAGNKGRALQINTNKLPSYLVNNLWFNTQPGALNDAVVLLGNQEPVTLLHNTFANPTPTTGKAILLYEPIVTAAQMAQPPAATGNAMTVTLHNTIFANISTSVAADQPGRPVQISHNLFWNSAPVGEATTAISADPQFVDLAAGDLRLQATSPAIDAGRVVAVTHDKIGVARPAGAGFDLGAYEFVTEPPPPPPPPPAELRAVDDGYLVASGAILTVTNPGVLHNDHFAADEAVQAVQQQVNTTVAGQLRLNPDGSFSYTSAPGFTGKERFVYFLQSAARQSNAATVTITVVKAEAIQRVYLPAIRR